MLKEVGRSAGTALSPPAGQRKGRGGKGLSPTAAGQASCRQPLFLWAGVGSKRYSLCALVPVLLDNGAQKKGILGSNEEFQSFKELVKTIRPLVSLNTSLPQQTLYDFCDSRKVSAFL